MLDLRAGVLGLGNMGGQVATIAARDYDIPAIALNSSNKDLDMVVGAKTFTIGNGRGTGKSRSLAKEYIEGSIEEFLEKQETVELIEENDIIFVVCSAGGGMGSGSGPALITILSAVYPHKLFVAAFSLPSIYESLAAQQHSLEFLDELETNCPNITYMVYDNDKYTGLPQSEIFKRVNEDIVKDICVLSGVHNLPTNLSSIDENDMLRLVNNKGRLVVGRLHNVQIKDAKGSITTALRGAINSSGQADLGPNPEDSVQGIGFICNLDNKFDDLIINITKDIQDEFSECIEDYAHMRVNDDGGIDEAYVILSGWDAPSRRIQAIKTKQEELQAVLEARKSKSIIGGGVDTTTIECARNIITRSIGDSKMANAKKAVDVSSLMAGFKRG